jgi:hypothetical protein
MQTHMAAPQPICYGPRMNICRTAAFSESERRSPVSWQWLLRTNPGQTQVILTDLTAPTGFFQLARIDAPTAWPDSRTTPNNTPLRIQLFGSDPQGRPLTFSIVDPPPASHGTLGPIISIDDTTAEVIFTPVPTFCGQTSFSFKVNNGYRDSEPALVEITVGTPDPVAHCQEVITQQMPVNIVLTGGTCSGSLTFAIGSAPSHGSLGSITQIDARSASVVYTPGSNFPGADEFWFTADNGSTPAWAQVRIFEAPPPVLTIEDCLPRSIVLTWTLPQWLHFGFVNDFRIYRCSTPSGTCEPTTLHAIVDDPDIIGNPNAWTFIDTDVEPERVYCYRVTFTRKSNCDCDDLYESPYSNTECSTTCCPDSQGNDLWTDYGPTPEELAQWIVGPNFTVSSVSYTGAAVARGAFGNGTATGLPINTGVILSTGDIALAKGPNDSSNATKDNSEIGDPDLDALLGAPQPVTEDAAVLEFDIVSSVATNLAIEYMFASEEYPEFVGSQYNDIMAIFVNGTNIALVPGTTLPVSVNNINGGFANPDGPNIPATHPEYYVDNSDPGFSALPEYSANVPVYHLQYDGTTVLLAAQANISANVTYRVKIAIADANDRDYDSAVFVKANVPCP